MTLNGAFVPGPRTHVPGAAAGQLAGLSFAVKDLIDVAGVPTGGGNPDWPRFAPTPAMRRLPHQRVADGSLVLDIAVASQIDILGH
jgi:amidase